MPINIGNLRYQVWSCLGRQLLVISCIFVLMPGRVWAADTEIQEVLLAAQVNRQSSTTLLFLRQKDGHLLVAAKDWQQWRLRLPPIPPVKYEGEDYYPLDKIKGVFYHVNDADLSVDITADVALFESTQLSGLNRSTKKIQQTPLGAFINYDVTSGYTDAQTKSNAFFEGVIFNHWGTLENQLLALDLEDNNRRFIRLDSTFTHDNPDRLTTLKVGDAITTDIGLGGNVRFAGVQWASNFALQPNKISFPLPAMAGQAVLPSTVDVFINNVKSLSREVPMGAFSIQDIPVVSGQGEARMVIKDLLGREQVVTLPYYVSPGLLQTGLQEYSYELGFAREKYGIDSQNYSHMLGVISHRIGLTNFLTGEFEGQILQKQQMLSYGGVFLWPELGVFHGLLATSWHHTYGAGHAVNLSFERKTSAFNAGVSIKSAAQSFVNLATEAGAPPIKQSGQFFVSVPLTYGSLSSSYTYQQAYDAQKTEFLQGSYSLSFGKWGALMASVSHSWAQRNQTTSQISLTIPLGFSTSTNLTIQPQNQQQRLSIQRSLPAGSGFGYDLVAERGQIERDEAALTLQNGVGTYKVRAINHDDSVDLESSIAGGVAFLNGEVFLSRRINNSFAVVQVPDYPNVRVYSHNQLVGKTGRQGTLLVPQLQAYQENTLRIDASDLPFDAQIAATAIDAVPAFRTGLFVPFPVKRSYAATLTLLLDNGEPVPAGAVVTSLGVDEKFPVGFRGELYITGLNDNNVLTVLWKNQSCELHITLVKTDELLPDLGSYICKGVKP